MIDQAELERKEELNDIKSVMSTAPGRRFIWRILSAGRIFQPVFSTDPLVMSFQEGQRNNALAIWNDVLEAAPEKYILCVRSIQELEEKRNARNRNTDDSFD